MFCNILHSVISSGISFQERSIILCKKLSKVVTLCWEQVLFYCFVTLLTWIQSNHINWSIVIGSESLKMVPYVRKKIFITRIIWSNLAQCTLLWYPTSKQASLPISYIWLILSLPPWQKFCINVYTICIAFAEVRVLWLMGVMKGCSLIYSLPLSVMTKCGLRGVTLLPILVLPCQWPKINGMGSTDPQQCLLSKLTAWYSSRCHSLPLQLKMEL